MAKLSDLDLNRVDGVDAPATRRKFLILKSEEEDEEKVNLESVLDKLEEALTALAKMELPDDIVDRLESVAKALELDLEFKRAPKPKGDEGEEEEEGYGYPSPKAPKKKVELDVDALAQQIASAVASAVTESLRGEIAKSVKALSRQPVAQDSTRKLGEGLFTDIIFGR